MQSNIQVFSFHPDLLNKEHLVTGQPVTTGDTVLPMGADRNGPFPCPGSALARDMTFPSMKYQVTITCTNVISNGYSLYCARLQ